MNMLISVIIILSSLPLAAVETDAEKAARYEAEDAEVDSVLRAKDAQLDRQAAIAAAQEQIIAVLKAELGSAVDTLSAYANFMKHYRALLDTSTRLDATRDGIRGAIEDKAVEMETKKGEALVDGLEDIKDAEITGIRDKARADAEAIIMLDERDVLRTKLAHDDTVLDVLRPIIRDMQERGYTQAEVQETLEYLDEDAFWKWWGMQHYKKASARNNLPAWAMGSVGNNMAYVTRQADYIRSNSSGFWETATGFSLPEIWRAVVDERSDLFTGEKQHRRARIMRAFRRVLSRLD